MRECLHIFRKDVRRFWPYAAILIAMRLMAVVLIAEDSLTRSTLVFPAIFLLPLANCLLLAVVFQEDSPCGDDQFWLTRPHRRASLLGAKALFAVVFINLPFLVSDLFLVPARRAAFAGRRGNRACGGRWCSPGGRSPARRRWPCVTRSVIQFAFLALLLFLTAAGVDTLVGSQMPQLSWGALSWPRACLDLLLFAGAAFAVIFWQYHRRGLALARGLLAGGFLAAVAVQMLTPWSAVWALPSLAKPVRAATVRTLFDSGRDPASLAALGEFRPRWGNRVRLELPVRIEGIPPGYDVVSDALNLCVEPDGDEAQCTGWSASHSLHSSTSGFWVRFALLPRFYDRLVHRPARLRIAMALALFADRETTEVAASVRQVRLSATAVLRREDGALVCRSLDPSERAVLTLEETGDGSVPLRRTLMTHTSYGPLTGDIEFVPYAVRGLRSTLLPAAARRLVITMQHPAGHFISGFETRVKGLEYFTFR